MENFAKFLIGLGIGGYLFSKDMYAATIAVGVAMLFIFRHEIWHELKNFATGNWGDGGGGFGDSGGGGDCGGDGGG